MKITRRQLRRLIRETILHEAQWGWCTGGAAPLDEPPLDSGNMDPEQQQKVFDILVATGSDPKKLLDSGAINKERGRIRTPSYDQVIQPIYKSSVYRWKNYTNELSKINLKIDNCCKYFDYKIN